MIISEKEEERHIQVPRTGSRKLNNLCLFFNLFLGYYLPNDDGEFYQFCYVTHKGEIRGASTPFQFRASSPVEELLTMEDEGNSDMLVVTTKAGLLEVGTSSELVIHRQFNEQSSCWLSC